MQLGLICPIVTSLFEPVILSLVITSATSVEYVQMKHHAPSTLYIENDIGANENNEYVYSSILSLAMLVIM